MNNDKIKELTFENYIWVIYIVVAIVNIYGDELIKKSIIEKDFQANKEAMKIFKSILIINIIIYFTFYGEIIEILKSMRMIKSI